MGVVQALLMKLTRFLLPDPHASPSFQWCQDLKYEVHRDGRRTPLESNPQDALKWLSKHYRLKLEARLTSPHNSLTLSLALLYPQGRSHPRTLMGYTPKFLVYTLSATSFLAYSFYTQHSRVPCVHSKLNSPPRVQICLATCHCLQRPRRPNRSHPRKRPSTQIGKQHSAPPISLPLAQTLEVSGCTRALPLSSSLHIQDLGFLPFFSLQPSME